MAGKTAKINYNIPAGSNIYNNVIATLDELTGIKWGFVRGGRRVQYVSSKEIPLKIGILWGKTYEKCIKYKLDIEIRNKTPRLFTSEQEWLDALSTELQIELLRLVKLPDVLETIRSWEPADDGEYAGMLINAEEQNTKHAIIAEKIARGEVVAVDYWLNECLR